MGIQGLNKIVKSIHPETPRRYRRIVIDGSNLIFNKLASSVSQLRHNYPIERWDSIDRDIVFQTKFIIKCTVECIHSFITELKHTYQPREIYIVMDPQHTPRYYINAEMEFINENNDPDMLSNAKYVNTVLSANDIASNSTVKFNIKEEEQQRRRVLNDKTKFIDKIVTDLKKIDVDETYSEIITAVYKQSYNYKNIGEMLRLARMVLLLIEQMYENDSVYIIDAKDEADLVIKNIVCNNVNEISETVFGSAGKVSLSDNDRSNGIDSCYVDGDENEEGEQCVIDDGVLYIEDVGVVNNSNNDENDVVNMIDDDMPSDVFVNEKDDGKGMNDPKSIEMEYKAVINVSNNDVVTDTLCDFSKYIIDNDVNNDVNNDKHNDANTISENDCEHDINCTTEQSDQPYVDIKPKPKYTYTIPTLTKLDYTLVISDDTDYFVLFSDVSNVHCRGIRNHDVRSPYKCWKTFLGKGYSYDAVIRASAIFGNDYTIHETIISAERKPDDLQKLFNIDKQHTLKSLLSNGRTKIYKILSPWLRQLGYTNDIMTEIGNEPTPLTIIDDIMYSFDINYFRKYFLSTIIYTNWRIYNSCTIRHTNDIDYVIDVQMNRVFEHLVAIHPVVYRWGGSSINVMFDDVMEFLETVEEIPCDKELLGKMYVDEECDVRVNGDKYDVSEYLV